MNSCILMFLCTPCISWVVPVVLRVQPFTEHLRQFSSTCASPSSASIYVGTQGLLRKRGFCSIIQHQGLQKLKWGWGRGLRDTGSGCDPICRGYP